MSVSSQESGHDEERLVRYLLGLLPDEDAERVDELTIADDEVAWRVRAVENDLVDAYVRGTLDGEARARFESFYLSSPRRREKVRFAETFLRAGSRAAAPADAAIGRDSARKPAAQPDKASSRGARWYHRILPPSRPPWMLAAAASLLLACGGLLFLDVRLRLELTQARRDGAALDRRTQELQQQLEDQRSARVADARELERARASLAEASRRPAPGPTPGEEAPPSSALTMLALVLMPQTRAAGPIPSLAVAPAIDRVAFDLRLESNDFPRYQVALKDPAINRVVWRSNTVTASGEAPTVSIVVPARLLKPQHYSLELTGHGAAGVAQVVGSYTFRIVRH